MGPRTRRLACARAIARVPGQHAGGCIAEATHAGPRGRAHRGKGPQSERHVAHEAADEEETLLELINDDDPVVASLAIDHARAHGVWALEQDIEHVLAHRDPRDWFVFEAASWALAEQRMPIERVRQLWLEPLPAAIVAGAPQPAADIRLRPRRRAVPPRECRPPEPPRDRGRCSVEWASYLRA